MEDLIPIILIIAGVLLFFMPIIHKENKLNKDRSDFTQYCYKQNMIPAKTEAGYFCVDQRNLVK